MSIAFEALASHLLANVHELLPRWLPNGRRQGREWCVGSLEGGKGQSLKINLDSGRWQDFATGEKGGDLIALYAAMHQMNQYDAARELGADSDQPAPVPYTNGHDPQPPDESGPAPIDPTYPLPPPEASYELKAFRHPQRGVPSARWIYRTLAGEPIHVVARYDNEEGKAYCPWSWDEGRWRARMIHKPRPLYGLERLAELTRRVVVVEGEKAADALQGVVTRSPVITWSAGATNWRYADWSPLQRRSVLLWPDADPPGVAAMAGVAERLLAYQCDVARIDTEGLPEGFDAADLIAQGLRGVLLNDWLKERTRRVERIDLHPTEPERVLDPGPVPGAVLIEHETQQPLPAPPTRGEEPPPHTEADIPARHDGRGYTEMLGYSLKHSRSGVFTNLANLNLLIRGLIAKGDAPQIWWDSFLNQIRTEEGEWSDRNTLEVLNFVQGNFALEKCSRDVIDQAVSLIAWENRRNCAQEWLSSLTWDGIERLEHLLPDGFGTPTNDYTRAVGRCFLMGMVARVMMPGCQVDNLPVFEGEQGITKSQALRALGGQWYAETMESVLNKDFYLALSGKMLVEVAEFSSFKRAEAEAIKAAIARPTDRYRVPYERRSTDHPRSCVFAATHNDNEWNLDPTGARRFWPVRCGEISVFWLQECREQLFAEARQKVMSVPVGTNPTQRIAAGAAWWDVPVALAREQQDERYQSDTIATGMRSWLKPRAGSAFTILDVMSFALGIEGPQRFDRVIQTRVRAQLIQWGYRSLLLDGERVWSKKGSVKPPDESPEE